MNDIQDAKRWLLSERHPVMVSMGSSFVLAQEVSVEEFKKCTEDENSLRELSIPLGGLLSHLVQYAEFVRLAALAEVRTELQRRTKLYRDGLPGGMFSDVDEWIVERMAGVKR